MCFGQSYLKKCFGVKVLQHLHNTYNTFALTSEVFFFNTHSVFPYCIFVRETITICIFVLLRVDPRPDHRWSTMKSWNLSAYLSGVDAPHPPPPQDLIQPRNRRRGECTFRMSTMPK